MAGPASGVAEAASPGVNDRACRGDSSLGASDTLRTTVGSGLLMLMMEAEAVSRMAQSAWVVVWLRGWLVA